MCWKCGISLSLINAGTFLDDVLHFILGDRIYETQPGVKAYLMGVLLIIWLRILYRIGRYFVNILEAVYLFIIEHRRLVKMSIWKKILYCFTWPVFDIIGRYTQYIALFKKVEWKPIPHESKVTIDDITKNSK